SDLAAVVPGRTCACPADHGRHPEFRIEWWYVTANLTDATGAAYGAQWTLFRQAIAAGGPQEGWGQQQISMRHAARTRASWAGPTPPSPAPIPIAFPGRSRAAGSARPASTPSRFGPGSMPGR